MGRVWPLLLLALPAMVGGCDQRPSAGRLAALRAEAQHENQHRAGSLPDQIDREIQAWTLTIEGQTASGVPTTIPYPELDTLATVHVRGPRYTLVQGDDVDVDYRGVPIATVLDRVPPAAGVTEATFLSFDGFRSTVQIADARTHPIALALEADGVRMTRSTAGPLFLIFPVRDVPELAKVYNWSSWSYYVNRMILGTEPVALRVGDRRLDLAALDALPATILEVTPKLRLGWPQGVVRLRGVALADLGVAGAAVIVTKAKAWKDLGGCAPVVVYRWGRDDAPIPARLGGPMVLALSADCAAVAGNSEWPTFVEAIEAAAAP